MAGSRVWIGWSVLLSLTFSLGACTTGTPDANTPPGALPSPTLRMGSPVVTVIPRPSVTHEMPTPPPKRTPATPIPRAVELNTVLTAVYVPAQAYELYVIEIDQPRRITVDIAAADEGPPLNLEAQVYDVAGVLVPPASASAGTPLLRAEWDLPTAGTYRVQVFGPETQRRTFALNIATLPLPTAGGGTLDYGDTRTGAIRVRGQRDSWTFAGTAGEAVVITMIALQADPVFELYDPSGELLRQVDDYADGQDALLSLDLPVTGTYTVVSRFYGDEQTGAYQLRVMLED